MRGTIRKGRPSFFVPMPALCVVPGPLVVLWFIQLEMDVWLLSVVSPSFCAYACLLCRTWASRCVVIYITCDGCVAPQCYASLFLCLCLPIVSCGRFTYCRAAVLIAVEPPHPLVVASADGVVCSKNFCTFVVV